ncbi:MAG: hypothetical protein HUU20_20580 [Pirellulales bacterium]|nr:hypothetical protein [Pirellulales bacterium]
MSTSTMPEQRGPRTLQEAPPPVRWRSWPLGEHPARGLLLLIALGAVFLAVEHQTGARSMAMLAVGALAIACWRFFPPAAFELNVDGVHLRALGRGRQIPWPEVQSYRVFSDGVLLLPFRDSSPIDALRGLYLPWRDRREEVLANLRFYLDHQERGAVS